MAKENERDTSESFTFDVKDYLRLSFELVNNKLIAIDKQTTETKADVQGVIKTIGEMQIVNAGHVFNCPTTSFANELHDKLDIEINKINLRFAEYDFFKKYWKIFAIGGAFTMVGMIITGWLAFSNLKDTFTTSTHPKVISYEFSKNQFPDTLSHHISRVTAH